MGVLFLIGRGEKDLDYVDFLFDLQKCPNRPPYSLPRIIVP